jgi:hypothetical protein
MTTVCEGEIDRKNTLPLCYYSCFSVVRLRVEVSFCFSLSRHARQSKQAAHKNSQKEKRNTQRTKTKREKEEEKVTTTCNNLITRRKRNLSMVCLNPRTFALSLQ